MDGFGGVIPVGSSWAIGVREWMKKTGAQPEHYRGINAMVEDDHRSSTLKARDRIGKLLRAYREPTMDATDFQIMLNAQHAELEAQEESKKELRDIFAFNTGNGNCYPKALKLKKYPKPENKYVGQKGMKMIGTNPYTKETRLLVYNKAEKWETFKPLAWESVLVGDKEKEIPSLTVEKMITVCEEHGVSMEGLGKVAVDYVKKHMSSVSAKVNNVTSEEVSLVFSTIANNLNVEDEMKMVEESIMTVSREPNGTTLSEAVNQYFGKQKLLARLRSGYKLKEKVADIEALASSHTMNALMSMVSEQVANKLMGPIQQQYKDNGITYTVEKALMEALKMEDDHPEWVPTTTRKASSVKAMSATIFPQAQAEVNRMSGVSEEPEDSNNVNMVEEDDEPEDMVLEDEYGDLHYIAKAKRVDLKPSKQGHRSRSKGPEKRNFSKTRFKAKLNLVQGRNNSKSPRLGRTGLDGAKTRIFRPARSPRSPGGHLQKRGPSKGRSKSPLRRPKACIRCGSENHLGDSCTRYRQFCANQCYKCKNNGHGTLFHPPHLCLHDTTSSYKEPGDRSPNTHKKYGFRSPGRKPFSKSPVRTERRSPAPSKNM